MTSEETNLLDDLKRNGQSYTEELQALEDSFIRTLADGKAKGHPGVVKFYALYYGLFRTHIRDVEHKWHLSILKAIVKYGGADNVRGLDIVAAHDETVSKLIERMDTQLGEKKIKRMADAKLKKALDEVVQDPEGAKNRKRREMEEEEEGRVKSAVSSETEDANGRKGKVDEPRKDAAFKSLQANLDKQPAAVLRSHEKEGEAIEKLEAKLFACLSTLRFNIEDVEGIAQLSTTHDLTTTPPSGLDIYKAISDLGQILLIPGWMKKKGKGKAADKQLAKASDISRFEEVEDDPQEKQRLEDSRQVDNWLTHWVSKGTLPPNCPKAFRDVLEPDGSGPNNDTELAKPKGKAKATPKNTGADKRGSFWSTQLKIWYTGPQSAAMRKAQPEVCLQLAAQCRKAVLAFQAQLAWRFADLTDYGHMNARALDQELMEYVRALPGKRSKEDMRKAIEQLKKTDVTTLNKEVQFRAQAVEKVSEAVKLLPYAKECKDSHDAKKREKELEEHFNFVDNYFKDNKYTWKKRE